jgi:GNAT superfamily N-acetyltransferase
VTAHAPATTVREATLADIPELVRLRLALMRSFLTVERPDEFCESTVRYLRRALADGTFVAAVAESEGRLVASSGMCLFHRLPLPESPAGLEGYVLNMYTEPEWRRRGLARALLNRLVELARARGVHRLWLHATEEGRPLYEDEGFAPNPSALERLLD